MKSPSKALHLLDNGESEIPNMVGLFLMVHAATPVNRRTDWTVLSSSFQCFQNYLYRHTVELAVLIFYTAAVISSNPLSFHPILLI
jgi:hypothetical protein